MTLRVLDLNDWELSLYSGDALAVQLPGFALVEPKDLIFGEQALKAHRRSPLTTHADYWHRMDSSPVRSKNRNVHTNADLVFHQLNSMIAQAGIQGEPMLLSVPSHYSNDQLAVLLGILEQTSIVPTALVDATVAAATTAPGHFVLDVSLHEMTLVRLRTAQGLLQRVTVESVPGGGLLPLLDAWLVKIADEFVRETRFDPLRIAETEQQLWTRLYAWLLGEVDALDNGLHMEVNNKGSNWQVNFDVRELEALSAELVRNAVAPCNEVERANLRVTPRAARIPGLLQGTRDAGIRDCSTLAVDALVRGINGNLKELKGGAEEGISFVTSLRMLTHTSMDAQEATRGQADSSATEVAKPAATHLVSAGVAYPVGEPIDLGALIPDLSGVDDLLVSRTGTRITIHRTDAGEREVLRSLACGEGFRQGGHEFLAVRIADHGA